MIYLSGCIVPQRHPKVGFILTPDMANKVPEGAVIAADNSCFTNPAGYSDMRYATFLASLPRVKTLFATAPDVLGNHRLTVARSMSVLHLIRQLGHKPAFVAQDGWTEYDTPWDSIDAIFVGGSTSFKFRGGRDAVDAAKKRGKWAHMGRVNSMRRLRAAASIGCDSADGTFLKFAPNINWTRLMRWIDVIDENPELWRPHENDRLALGRTG